MINQMNIMKKMAFWSTDCRIVRKNLTLTKKRTDDEEDGECQICKNGGDLIVCDGGNHEGGCVLAYHIHCIDRSIIPPGEFKRH